MKCLDTVDEYQRKQPARRAWNPYTHLEKPVRSFTVLSFVVMTYLIINHEADDEAEVVSLMRKLR
jgi:hypothetical protein